MNWGKLGKSVCPQQNINEEPVSAAEIQFAITKSRTRSSPSQIDRIPYLILKRCPSLAPVLIDLFNCCWCDGVIPSGWKKKGVIHLIPKASAVEKPQDPSNSRPITLTSCVGKLFTSILKNRWLTYMVTNAFIGYFCSEGSPPRDTWLPGTVPKACSSDTAILKCHT